MLSHFSHVGLFTTLWAVAHQAPLSMGFSRQEYWSGLPCPPLGELPNPGIELCLLHFRLILYHWTTGVFLLSYIKIFSWITAVCTLVSSSKLWTLWGQIKHLTSFWFSTQHKGLPRWCTGKESACRYRRHGFDPCVRKIPSGSLLQYSCPENPMDRGAWQAMVHGVTKSRKQPRDWAHTHAPTQHKILKFSINFWIELWWLHHTISIKSVLLVW